MWDRSYPEQNHLSWQDPCGLQAGEWFPSHTYTEAQVQICIWDAHTRILGVQLLSPGTPNEPGNLPSAKPTCISLLWVQCRDWTSRNSWCAHSLTAVMAPGFQGVQRLTDVIGAICQAPRFGCCQAGLPETPLGADSWNSLAVALVRFTRKQHWLLLALLWIFLSPPRPSALRAVQWLHCKPATAFPTVPTRKANSRAAPVMWTADTSWM